LRFILRSNLNGDLPTKEGQGMKEKTNDTDPEDAVVESAATAVTTCRRHCGGFHSSFIPFLLAVAIQPSLYTDQGYARRVIVSPMLCSTVCLELFLLPSPVQSRKRRRQMD
jgi:hypothetical protein